MTYPSRRINARLVLEAHPDYRKRGRRRVAPSTRALVLERDGHRCVRCGSTNELTMNHIVPACLGGSYRAHNLETMCGPCNNLTFATLIRGLAAELILCA